MRSSVRSRLAPPIFSMTRRFLRRFSSIEVRGQPGIWAGPFTLKLPLVSCFERTHSLLRYVTSYQLTESIPAHTRDSEVNTSEYPGIGDLLHRRRKAGKRSRTRTDVR